MCSAGEFIPLRPFFSLLLFLLQLHVFPCRRPCLWTGHASLPGVSISAGLGAHPSSAPDASAASDASCFPADQSTEPTPAFPALPSLPLPSPNPSNPFCELPLQCKVTDAFPHAMKKKRVKDQASAEWTRVLHLLKSLKVNCLSRSSSDASLCSTTGSF